MKELLSFLNGKKTYIGILGWLAVKIFYPEGGTNVAPEWLMPVIYSVLGVGVTHKFSKSFEK